MSVGATGREAMVDVQVGVGVDTTTSTTIQLSRRAVERLLWEAGVRGNTNLRRSRLWRRGRRAYFRACAGACPRCDLNFYALHLKLPPPGEACFHRTFEEMNRITELTVSGDIGNYSGAVFLSDETSRPAGQGGTGAK